MPNFLNNICSRWGYPEAVIADNGVQFKSRAWERYLRQNHINHYLTPIYHQRANPVERRNQELKKILRVQLRDTPENRWDENLLNILFVLHSRRNAATGMTPSQLLLGTPLVRPGEWEHPVNQQPVQNDAAARQRRVRQARARQVVVQKQMFPRHQEAPVHYQAGDMVLVRSFPGVKTPFGAPWSGPHSIVQVLGDNVYEVERHGVQDRVHVDDLRPAPGPAPDIQNEPDVLARPPDDDEEEPPLQGGATASGSVDDEAASQASNVAAVQGSGRPCHLFGIVGDGAGHVLNEPSLPELSHSPVSPQPGPSKPYTHHVTVEDITDSEDEQREGCSYLGAPIIFL